VVKHIMGLASIGLVQ